MALVLFTSCGNTSKTRSTKSTTTNTSVNTETTASASTSSNTEMKMDASKPAMQENGMIVGLFHESDLQQEPFATWFNSGFESYEPNTEAMSTIKDNISNYEIIAFMGTWCPDSRREVPKFFKLLEDANYPMDKLTIYGVDRSKITPDNKQEKWELNRVPTFIFLKNGQEVNRFVERPRESLEQDIAKIVSSAEYSNSYAN